MRSVDRGSLPTKADERIYMQLRDRSVADDETAVPSHLESTGAGRQPNVYQHTTVAVQSR